jgi:hypothetical protein
MEQFPDYNGVFNIQITVTANEQPKLFSFLSFLPTDMRVVRYLMLSNMTPDVLINPHIESRMMFYGDNQIQPTLVFKFKGNSIVALCIACSIAEIMEHHELNAIRIRLASQWNSNIRPPLTKKFETEYFEQCVSYRVEHGGEWNVLSNLGANLGAHLYFDATYGLQPFIIMRDFTTVENAELQFNKLLTNIDVSKIINFEREYVIYDSNMNMDKNWLFVDSYQKPRTTVVNI